MTAMAVHRRLVLLAIGSAILAGCASMLPQLQPPGLSVTAVAFAGGNLQQQQIHLTLHATNPNARAIAVRGIDLTLELEGQSFASGATDAAFTLPASGETDFGLTVNANINNALLALAGGFGHNTVDYRLYGQVHLSGGIVRTIPFDQKGRVRL
jgi:LEA14-like dessication related protein